MSDVMDAGEVFRRAWEAFEAGDFLPACAWCGRVRIDGTWLVPSGAALAAIDQRQTLSHSICDDCVETLAKVGRARGERSKNL